MSNESVLISIRKLLESINSALGQLEIHRAGISGNNHQLDAAQATEAINRLIGMKHQAAALTKIWARSPIIIPAIPHAPSVPKKPTICDGGHRNHKTGLIVKMPSGRVHHEKFASDTFASALHEIGFDRVRALNFQTSGVPLISGIKDDTYNQTKVGNTFVMTHSSTKDKKEVLLEVARRLGVQLEVQIVK